jgi:hypothetical protein
MSGGGNSAAREADRAEKERQAAIARTQQQVNAVFDGPAREGEIGEFMEALRARSTDDLDRRKGDTDRQLKFALARAGQVGGSTERDKRRVFTDDYTRALLNLERGVQGAGADLRASDQDARARLIQLATNGLDATTGARQASESMRVNLQSASAGNLSNQLGDAFGDWSKYFQDSRDDAARRTVHRNNYGLYAPIPYGGGG